MLHSFRWLSLGLTALGVASLLGAWVAREGGRTAGAATPSIVFAPASSTLALGVTPVPTVDISVADASGVAGYDAWVTFNGSVVQLSSLADSGFLSNPNPQGTPQNVVVCDTPTITAAYGHISCSVLPLPSPFPPPVLPAAGSTPAALVHASFNPAASGSSPLSLTAVAGGTPETTTLFDLNGTPVGATLGSGSITVTAPSVGGVAEAPDVAALRAAPTSTHKGVGFGAATIAGAVAILIAAVAVAWRRRNPTR